MSRSFAGAGVALITPFTKSGDLDEAAFRRLVKRQVEAGIDVLVPCGTTGESATLSAEEQKRVIAITVEEAGGRVPVLAGAGANDTRVAVEKSKAAAALGASGILSVGPYYNKPTPEGYYRHFATIADAVSIPIVVYNVPGRTGSNIDVKTQLRLATHPNIAAVKEASGNLGQVMEILRDRPLGFEVLSGDDANTLAFMALGGEGVISVAANQVPGPMHDLTAACAGGDFKTARSLHQRLLKLMNLNFIESNPVPVKASLALMGLCEESFRLPLCPPTESTREALRGALSELGLLS
ncbi:MAG TPA: 4-hydroxy-tetrahydrodipicolinate synthase [Vicinamibacteria bacterium]|nr:4-hydroxy-tetrahydrodipicolinate synthase [Vicinamibacteria bacterium]